MADATRDFPSFEAESLEGYIAKVTEATRLWPAHGLSTPWFRGQRDCSKDPIPSIFRIYDSSRSLKYTFDDEFWMVTSFRNRAPAMEISPETDRLDKWLFLMQHHRLPTRLLDWTESSLVGLFFAVRDNSDTDSAVWILNPLGLNSMTTWGLEDGSAIFPLDNFPNTWSPGKVGSINFDYCFNNLDITKFRNTTKLVGNTFYQLNPGRTGAEYRLSVTTYPIAVQPTYVHNRMVAQRSVFTIHGAEQIGFEELATSTERKFLLKCIIRSNKREPIREQLKTSGMRLTSVFPELDSLSAEIAAAFQLKKSFMAT